MPTHTLPNGVEFLYEDSGAPDAQNYTTLFVVHGHTYHSGLFKPLMLLAHSRAYRMIAVNRREYPGSSPYTDAELKVFAGGSDEERFNQLISDGSDLAVLLDGLIGTLQLPEKGGVALVGWSMGNIFTLSMLASIDTLPAPVRRRLSLYVKRAIMWEPPSQPMGIESPPGSYLPLWDEQLPPEARGIEFGKWVTYYFVHGDLSNHDMKNFNYHWNDPNRKRTFEDLSLQNLFKLIDLGPGGKCDTLLCEPPFQKAEREIVNKALFDLEVRNEWRRMKVWHFYGDANSWNVYLTAWMLEDKVKAKGNQLGINFAVLKGSNHFAMWDCREALMDTLELCINT